MTVNGLGETLTSTDRNGTVHTYVYNSLGRLFTDTVTTLGSGVDGTIRRVAFYYSIRGQHENVVTYDATSGGNIVNAIYAQFNGLGQQTREYQSHDGAVVTGGGSPTPSIGYA